VSDAIAVSSPPVKKSTGRALRSAALMLVIATVIAMAGTATILLFVVNAYFLTAAAQSVADLMFRHSLLAIAAAGSPIVAALLVGYGYMQKGLRKRALAARAAAAAGMPAAAEDTRKSRCPAARPE